MILTIMKNKKRNMKFLHSSLKILQHHQLKLHQVMKAQKVHFYKDLQLYKAMIRQNKDQV